MKRPSAIEAFRSVGAKVLKIPKFEYPSEWMAREFWISGSTNGTGQDSRFDIWYFPCNVGIVDSLVEPKRGSYCQKAVQMAVSHYMQGACMYVVSRIGGPTAYSMAKEDTMRDHVLDRFDVALRRSEEIRSIHLPGRDNHETLHSKRFVTGTLKLFGAGSQNNFRSNPYKYFFADEFEAMKVFPDGTDGPTSAKGRQSAFTFPFFVGWTSPLEAYSENSRGIEKAIRTESDMRRFYWRCPHCKQPITVSFLENVHFDRHADTNKPIPESAKLLCPECSKSISDTQRSVAMTTAAKAACKWYTAVPYDPDVGWKSTLPPEEAEKRQYAGFMGLDHLHNPNKKLLELAIEFCNLSTEAAKKTFWNEKLGLGYTIKAQELSRANVEDRLAETKRVTIPNETLWLTFGSDVQGGGHDPNKLTFYYDISAWVRVDPFVRKITLFIDRMTSTKADGWKTIKSLIRDFSIRDRTGAVRKIDCAVIDGGFEAEKVNEICNSLCGGRSQWVFPCLYGSRKPTDAPYEPMQQNASVGDRTRKFILTSRDYLVQKYVDFIMSDDNLLELPPAISEEIIRHYTANEQVERHDAHGNYLGVHWQKKTLDNKRQAQDDFFAAGCYSLMAALLLGLEEQAGVDIQEAKEEAEKLARERNARDIARSAAAEARRNRLIARSASRRGSRRRV